MRAEREDLHKLRGEIARAQAAALRLGNTTLVSHLTKSMAGIDRMIAELDQGYARTLPQVEALKRLVGAT